MPIALELKEYVLTKDLVYFHVASGFPPDVAHDAFEGIVELAYCLQSMVSKKLFTIDGPNKAILSFPYKWSDKTNKPHVVPVSLVEKLSEAMPPIV